MSFEQSDLRRRVNNLIRLGTVAETDESTQQLRVQTGEILTGWLPWPAEIGANFRRWRPLRIGQQVVLISPSGEINNALVLVGLYDTDNPTPNTDPGTDTILFDDGTEIKKTGNKLIVSATTDIQIHSAGEIALTAGGGIKLNSPSLTHNGKNVGHTHKHSGIIKGGDNTGGPV